MVRDDRAANAQPTNLTPRTVVNMASAYITATVPLYIRASILASCVAMCFGYALFSLTGPLTIYSQ